MMVHERARDACALRLIRHSPTYIADDVYALDDMLPYARAAGARARCALLPLRHCCHAGGAPR